ncbi:hypothetical protein PW52_11960 [Tamlana sedimentorum]|uniref:Glycosyl transferase family 1 domain-containing protein n=1 Tax=Neotamlana sedimentorum TaxID=1435349 RepID=A0A0D7W7F0_9FLAO|nr:glycosyltransferase [Tamlana sedimentorum]KJD35065.1 hypothetical protein PW52_11960 [Tamlana sedimentorum]
MQKVCIVTTSLASGGAERSTALLSQMLCSLGYNVHVVSTKNNIEYAYSGTLFNLEKAIHGSTSNWLKTKVLKAYFKENNFNYVIDNRPYGNFFKEFLLYRVVFGRAKIIKVIRSFNLVTYFPRNKFLARLVFGGVNKFVAVSKEIKSEIELKYGFKNATVIYNPINIEKSEKEIKQFKPLDFKYILFFGRVQEASKNLSLLIDGYKRSQLPRKQIKLVILGSGPDLNAVKAKVKACGLVDFITFIPFQADPYNYVELAEFTVLTSRYEGFPRSVVESLSMGTPVISVNCKSGPKEIIKDKYNGLLIKNNCSETLATAMNTFVDNNELYFYCKKNAKQSVKHLSANKIALHWRKILLNE